MSDIGDHLARISEVSTFGYSIGDRVRILGPNIFSGQVQPVTGFTRLHVIVTVSGPVGEEDSEWWFLPAEIELVASSRQWN